MPIFEQKCLDCGVIFEAIVLTREPYDLECPNCHSRKWERLVSTCASVIKAPTYGAYRGDRSNPFENFTVENIRVRDAKTGKQKKLKVNSLTELRAAEKEHHFSLDIASMDKPHDDKPPTNEAWAGDIVAASGYEWKWVKDKEARAKSMASPIVSVDCGIAASQSETLAGKMKEGKVA
jgi:putative FmdB family regulatory protein